MALLKKYFVVPFQGSGVGGRICQSVIKILHGTSFLVEVFAPSGAEFPKGIKHPRRKKVVAQQDY